jgi:hypothetical protein
VWPLFVLVAINAGVSAVDSPARHAIVPGLVGTKLLPASLALNQTLTNAAAAALPAVAGLLIATAGLPFCYGTEMVLFLIGAALMMRVPDVPTLPEMGTGVFGGDAFTVGLLYSAFGVGALIGALTSGWVSSVIRQGRATIIAVVGWGLAIVVFGFTESLPVALIMLGLAGAADVVSAIFRGSIVQLTAPDELRGRMGGMHTAVVAGGPRLGDLEAGVVAELTSIRFSVVSGGFACIVGALLIARWAPEFLNYRYEPGKE